MRQPPMITSMRDVKMKIELLEALGDIQVALKILNEGDGDGAEEINPVDHQYRQLQCKLDRMEPGSEDFELISDFITSTHGRTHTLYKMNVEEVFECRKDSEDVNFKGDLGNRMLLFHGSRLSNWAGILNQGLRIAPPEAPSTGYMFGKGIYFADVASKSANYCWPTPSKNEGLLLLCEVALGRPNELLSADCNANCLPAGCHSVKGLGQNAPDAGCTKSLSDGTVVPMGPPVKTGVAPGAGGSFTLAYNEYIVYDPSQVKMRYLAKIRFDFSK